jgi:hypothetical protein
MSEKIARTSGIRLKNARIKCQKIRLLQSKPLVVKSDTEEYNSK